MNQKLLQHIEEWLRSGIIDKDTAKNIIDFEQRKNLERPSLLSIIIVSVASLLVSLGIILLFAHNWDNFTRNIRLIISFIPLLLGQGLFIYHRHRKTDNIVWREGSSIIWIFGFLCCLALVGQIYHLTPDPADFFHICAWISFFTLLFSNSVAALLLYYLFIVLFLTNFSFAYDHNLYKLYFIILVLVSFPIAKKIIHNTHNNFIHFWLGLGISATLYFALIKSPVSYNPFEIFHHLSAFLIFLSLSYLLLEPQQQIIKRIFFWIGLSGSCFIMFIFSFIDYWQHYKTGDFFQSYTLSLWQIFLFIAPLCIMLFGVLLKKIKLNKIWFEPGGYIIITSMVTPFAGIANPLINVILVHLLLIGVSIHCIKSGQANASALWINVGLILIFSLIICRFFDLEFSFITRGIAFILLGFIFLGINFYLNRKKPKS